MRYLQTPAGMTPLAGAMQRYLQTPGGMVSLADPTLADLDLTAPDDSTIDKFYSNVQSFSRSSISTVKDVYGLLNTIGNDEIPWHGAMRVENLLRQSLSGRDYTNVANWTRIGSPTILSANTFRFPADSSSRLETAGLYAQPVVGTVMGFRVTLSVQSPHPVRLLIQEYPTWIFTDKIVTVTSQPTTFFVKHSTVSASSAGLIVKIQNNAATVSPIITIHDVQVEVLTGLPSAQQVPGPYVAFNVVHNSNIAGVKYFPFDRSHISVDANGVVSEAGTKVYHPVAYESQGSSTNYLLNSSVPATQSVSLAAGTYTCWLEGAGSVELSGAASGTVTESAKQTFTLASAGSVTVAVTAPVTRFQLEPGRIATAYMPTTSAATSRAAPSMSLKPGLLTDAEGALGVEMEMLYASADKPTGAGDYQIIGSSATTREIYDHNSEGAFGSYDATNLSTVSKPHASGNVLQFALSWGNGAKNFSGRNGAGTWTDSTVGLVYDGSFNPDGFGVRVGNGNKYPFRLRKFKTWKMRDIAKVKVSI